jgi:hypothetical protein
MAPIASIKKSELAAAAKSAKMASTSPTPAPATEPPVIDAPASTTEVIEAPVIEAPVIEAPVIGYPVAAPPAPTDKISSAIERVTELLNAQKVHCASLKDMISTLKDLQKDVVNMQKTAMKKKRSSTNPDGTPRPLSGVAKPSVITDELADFMAVAHGTLASRPQAVKSIVAYVRANDRYAPGDKRMVQCDEKLATLLRLEKDEKFKWLQLQAHLKVHFQIKSPAATSE